MLDSQATSLINLINYQEGSVVSREIINKPAGTVTIFAFDQSQSLSEHTAPYDALIFVLDGRTNVVIDGKTHPLATSEMIIIPANHPHSIKAAQKFKMLLVMIKS